MGGGAGAVVARPWAVTLAAMSLLALAPRGGEARLHPLHTTLTQLTVDAGAHRLTGTVRVFAADLAAAVAKRARTAVPADDRVSDPATFAYVMSAVHLTDAQGRPIALTGCGSRRTADLLWLCVRADALPAGPLAFSNQLLCELYDDQVNIVQTVDGAHTASTLFTKGDGAKRLF